MHIYEITVGSSGAKLSLPLPTVSTVMLTYSLNKYLTPYSVQGSMSNGAKC